MSRRTRLDNIRQHSKEGAMKKKTTKKKTTTGARKAKVHDLSARKRAAAAAKGGASVGVSSIVDPKVPLQGPSCWIDVGPGRRG